MSMLAVILPQLAVADSWLLQGMLPRRQSHGVEEPVEVDPMSLDSSWGRTWYGGYSFSVIAAASSWVRGNWTTAQ